MYFRKFYSIAMLIILFCASTFADDVLKANATFKVTVLYPDVRKPYSTIFESIISGIKEHSQINLHAQRIDKSMTEAKILKSLHQDNPDAVIMLGGGFKSLQEKINNSFKTIHGASFFSNHDINKGLSGVSMDPAPALLFKELKKLHPSVKRIHVVFDPSANGWLIHRAQENTNNSEIKLIPHKVTSVQQAALTYKEIAQNNHQAEDALWLLHHDPTLDSKSLLPRILVDAWKYKQIVISSNPSHVRRGALLSLLPDNQQIGKDLALNTISMLNGHNVSVVPMQSSLVVANIRTAKHLTSLITLKQKNNFALTYPRGMAND